MKKVDYFNFEIYTKNPITKETGWNIEFISVLANSVNEARNELKNYPDFDCVILFNYRVQKDRVTLRFIQELPN